MQPASVVIAPLKGDGYGRYRVHIVGNSGTGKSTLAVQLQALLHVPYIALDSLYWKPNWAESSNEDFRQKVEVALGQSPQGWIVDGNYTSRGLGIDRAATDVIWLDPPLLLYLPRLCLRTLRRLLGLSPPCSPGCTERVREVFCSSDSIVWWCISQHWAVRRRFRQRMNVDGIHVGGKIRQLGGWGTERETWLQSVREMVRCE